MELAVVGVNAPEAGLRNWFFFWGHPKGIDKNVLFSVTSLRGLFAFIFLLLLLVNLIKI